MRPFSKLWPTRDYYLQDADDCGVGQKVSPYWSVGAYFLANPVYVS